MVRIVLREDDREKKKLEATIPKVKAAVNVVDSILTAIEIMSTSKTVRVARMLKELLDIFIKR
jgi:uncharacterized protein YerC